jgi:hypothetical protein
MTALSLKRPSWSTKVSDAVLQLRRHQRPLYSQWSGEFSVLMLGLNLEAAKSLARHYEQHAFVWSAGGGVPELVQP